MGNLNWTNPLLPKTGPTATSQATLFLWQAMTLEPRQGAQSRAERGSLQAFRYLFAVSD
jgi:hypothetical protein